MLTRRQTLKIVLSFCALIFVASCAQSQNVAPVSNANETIVSSTPPFQTKEPERYRATRTITTVTANGETTVTKTLIARDGEWRRDEPDRIPERWVFLYGPGGKYLLFPNSNAFVDLAKLDQTETSVNEEGSDTSPDRLLHTDPVATTYQKIGPETVNGRTTLKYRAVVNSFTGTNVSANETLIWVDEELQMPIKSETKSGDGKRVTMVLSDISLDVERALFVVPKDYQEISPTDFRNHWSTPRRFSEIGKP